MLIEFTVENFRSIRGHQTLSMVASTTKSYGSSHAMEAGAPASPPLLRSAVIYGANAAGKSNMLKALASFKEIVTNSANSSVGGKLPYQPFLLSEESKTQPSSFEVIFVEDSVRYQYGVTFDKSKVISEWLFAFPEGRSQRWFERSIDGEGIYKFDYGPNLKGQKKVWQDATRPNALFLSTAVQLNSDQLKPVFGWFSEKLKGIAPFARVNENYTMSSSAENPVRKKQILEFMIQADLGISDFEIKKIPFVLDDEIPESLREMMREFEGKELDDVRFLHRSNSGVEAYLELEDESGGTSKLFALAGPWIDVLENGYVLIVDELDTSLHPVMLKYLVEMFHDPTINKMGAQLVFTTHDTNALNMFRRDQIWFMEKGKSLESALIPLSDYSPRKGESLEKRYLEGRYGGIPLTGGLAGSLFVSREKENEVT